MAKRFEKMPCFAPADHFVDVNKMIIRQDGHRIDWATCIVQQTRTPDKCRGCIKFKKG